MRIRTSLHTTAADDAVLRQVGEYLGSVQRRDLAYRCSLGRVPLKRRGAGSGTEKRPAVPVYADASCVPSDIDSLLRMPVVRSNDKHAGRAERKRAMTPATSGRWAAAITRVTADQYERAMLNIESEMRDKIAAARVIRSRLRKGDGKGGYRPGERAQKRKRLQILIARVRVLWPQYVSGKPSVCVGGRGTARRLTLLDQEERRCGELIADMLDGIGGDAVAGVAETDAALRTAADDRAALMESWRSKRLFLTCDGDRAYPHGNGQIAVDPDTSILTMTLPHGLAHLANRPKGRYEFAGRVQFAYNTEPWEDAVRYGSVRYDISYNTDKRRWYIDASSKLDSDRIWQADSLETLRQRRTLGIDLNADHIAGWVVAPDGNPTGPPVTLPLDTSGGQALTDARIRHLIEQLIAIARDYGCASVTIENLDFADARSTGRETMGRGKRGKRFRKTVSGIPTAKLKDRLASMCARSHLAVIAVDPAYTTKWGKQWLPQLELNMSSSHSQPSGHHAAGLVTGRRALALSGRCRKQQRKPTSKAGRAPLNEEQATPGAATKPHGHNNGTRTLRQSGNASHTGLSDVRPDQQRTNAARRTTTVPVRPAITSRE